jgi:GT2 family glycosyltransferase
MNATEEQPTVSVIVPVYNGADVIGDCIDALLHQEDAPPFEVIVVDDGSTDRTAAIVEPFAQKDERLRLVRFNRNRGRYAARNAAAEIAQGSVLVFTDADCVPATHWLREMLKPFRDAEVAGVGGSYRTLNDHHLVARYVGYEIAERHARMARLPDVDHIGTFSAAYRTEVFHQVGDFVSRGTAGEEIDMHGWDAALAYRVRKLGYRLVFNPRAYVYHRHPDTLSKFLRQQFSRGFWRVHMMRRQPGRITGGDSYAGHDVQVQGLLSLGLLISLPLLALRCWRWLTALAGLALVLSNLRTGLFGARREKAFIVVAPLLASLRSVAATLGALTALPGVIRDVARQRLEADSP